MNINIDSDDVGIACRCRWLSVVLDISIMQRIIKYADALISSISPPKAESPFELKEVIFNEQNNQKLAKTSYSEVSKENVRFYCDISYLRVTLSVRGTDFSSVRLSGISMDLAVSSDNFHKVLKISQQTFEKADLRASRIDMLSKTRTRMKVIIDEICVFDQIPGKGLLRDSHSTQTLPVLEQTYDGQLSLDLEVDDHIEYSNITYTETGSKFQAREQIIVKNENQVTVAVTTRGLKLTLLLRFIDDLVYYLLTILDCFDPQSTPTPNVVSKLVVSMKVSDVSVIFPRSSLNIDEALKITAEEANLLLENAEEIAINVREICAHTLCYPTGLAQNVRDRPVLSYKLLEKTNVDIMVNSKGVEEQPTKITSSQPLPMQTSVELCVTQLHCHFGQPQYNILMALISEHLLEEMNFGRREDRIVKRNLESDEYFDQNFSFDISEEGLLEAIVISLRLHEIFVDIEAVEREYLGTEDTTLKSKKSVSAKLSLNGHYSANSASTIADSTQAERLMLLSIKDFYCGVSIFESLGQIGPSDAVTKVNVRFQEASIDDVRYDHIYKMQPSIVLLKQNGSASQNNLSNKIDPSNSAMHLSVAIRSDNTVALEIKLTSVFIFLPYLALGGNKECLVNDDFRFASLSGTVSQLIDIFEYEKCERWTKHLENKMKITSMDDQEKIPLTITNIILSDISVHVPISYPSKMTAYDCLHSGYPNCTNILYIDVELLRCLLVTGGEHPTTRILIDMIDWNIGKDDDVVGGIIDGGSLNLKTTIRQEDKVRGQNVSVSDSSGKFNAAYVYEKVGGNKEYTELLTDIIIDLNVYRDIHITSAFSDVVLIKEIMHAAQNENKYFASLIEGKSKIEHPQESANLPVSSYHVSADHVHISGIHWKLVDDRSISPAKPIVFIAGLNETNAKVSLHYQKQSNRMDDSNSAKAFKNQAEFLMSGKLTQILYVKHLNSTFESTIETVDPWPYTIQCEIVTSKTKGLVEDFWFESNHRLNVYYAHSLLRCVNDIMMYFKYVSAALAFEPQKTQTVSIKEESSETDLDSSSEIQELEQDIEEGDNHVKSSYTIVNHSGLCLWYGRDVKATMSESDRSHFSDTQIKGKTYKVHHNDADILRINPQIKDIYVQNKTKWELRKSSHSVVLWFEGCWTPIEIVIDRVGKTKYDILSPTETSKAKGRKNLITQSSNIEEKNKSTQKHADDDGLQNMLLMHVVVDVVLFSRNKVIHIHSSLWLQNLTKFVLSYKLYMPKTPIALKRKSGMVAPHNYKKYKSASKSYQLSDQKKRSTVKSAYDYYEKYAADDEVSMSTFYITLESGQGMFLPLYAMLDGLLYVKIDNQHNSKNANDSMTRNHDLYGWSERDVIYLSGEAERLKHQQGSLQINYAPTKRKKGDLESQMENGKEKKNQQLTACLEICLSRKGAGNVTIEV